MKFNCGKTRKEKEDAKKQWHKWFAWHPVRLGSRDCRWLETIERKGDLFTGHMSYFWMWDYREGGETS